MKYFRILTCVLAICSHWAFAQSDKIECLSELTDQSENAHYVIQLENQLCQEENAINYIVCDLKLPEQEVEDQCTLTPRRILTEKKLSSDTIVIGLTQNKIIPNPPILLRELNNKNKLGLKMMRYGFLKGRTGLPFGELIKLMKH